MIYSYMKPSTVTESNSDYELTSVVWNEYYNYKQMLESCTDESAKPVLEAQVTILREVSIKDIVQKIIDKFHEIIEWIKKVIQQIKNKLSEIFDRKNSVLKGWESVKKVFSEAVIYEISDKDIPEGANDDGLLSGALWEYAWTYGSSQYSTTDSAKAIESSMNKVEVEIEKMFGSIMGGYRHGHSKISKEKVDEIVEAVDKIFDMIKDAKDDYDHIVENIKFGKLQKEQSISYTKQFLLKRGNEIYNDIKELDKQIQQTESSIAKLDDVGRAENEFKRAIKEEADHAGDDMTDDVKEYYIQKMCLLSGKMISIAQSYKATTSTFAAKLISAQNKCVSRLSIISKYASGKKWKEFV